MKTTSRGQAGSAAPGSVTAELLDAGRQVFLARDAIGSRRAESKETAIARMGKNAVEVVTTEMVLFEWLGTAQDPRLREVLALVK